MKGMAELQLLELENGEAVCQHFAANKTTADSASAVLARYGSRLCQRLEREGPRGFLRETGETTR